MAACQATPKLPSGDQSAVEPPGPIPNPEVKRCSADGSGTIGPVRVGRRQVHAPPRTQVQGGALFCPRFDIPGPFAAAACCVSPIRSEGVDMHAGDGQVFLHVARQV